MIKQCRKGAVMRNLIRIFIVALQLGLTSFGGPTAHIAYFHEAYVKKRKWLDDESYTQLVALAQFLPGPASSQVGVAIGIIRGGVIGGIVAFIGFTLPSAVVLMMCALTLQQLSGEALNWLHGLKLVAVAVVAHALVGMTPKLAHTSLLKIIALTAFVAALLIDGVLTQLVILVVAAVMGYFLHKGQLPKQRMDVQLSKRLGATSLALFCALLIALPLLAQVSSNILMQLFDDLYRTGALVFGGGHVVLPFLQQQFVATGLLDETTFLAGYSLAQAVPGPLFTFASYIGAAMSGWGGGIIATLAIFLPGCLLMIGVLPFWQSLQQYAAASRAVAGVNAAVVGILGAALYTPIWTTSITAPIDVAIVVVLFCLLQFWKVSPLLIVVIGFLAGGLSQ